MVKPPADAVVTAVLGSTNTGKTHLAIERMLAHQGGVIGLPLRLLAREVYDKLVAARGTSAIALITGEEKINPPGARYHVCTVEAMPTQLAVPFVAIDEVQLCADPDRGHIFTDRLLHVRGAYETMFLGAETMRPLIRQLVPEARIEHRERFSKLSYLGPRKLTKLPRRTAIVAFSANEVYAIAELIRRQRGGAAVVMGALSPRTRNAQVALYQSGEVDFLVATDAIGMGLNMDVDHVAFAATTKFDGRRQRALYADEMAQIAGRAGRFRTDGTFGETGQCADLLPETVARIESHEFEPKVCLEWRHANLDFSSPTALMASLRTPSRNPVLHRTREALDERTLNVLLQDEDLMAGVVGQNAVKRLWQVAQTPDFRNTTPEEHYRLIGQLAAMLLSKAGRLPAPWLEQQLKRLDSIEGDIDQLQMRLAYIRTYSYAANREDWVENAAYWRDMARLAEDRISDALHERLMQRFIDRRTNALLRGLKREDVMAVEIDADGGVTVEGHYLGALSGLEFIPDPRAGGIAEKAVRNAAIHALRPELTRRLMLVASAEGAQLHLSPSGEITFDGTLVARLVRGNRPLAPGVALVGGELGPDLARSAAQSRLQKFVEEVIEGVLGALCRLSRPETTDSQPPWVRGVAYRLAVAGGVVLRSELGATGEADHDSSADPGHRTALKALGVVMGRHALYLPELTKPKALALNCLLRAVFEGGPMSLLSPLNRVSWPAPTEAGPPPPGILALGTYWIRLDAVESLLAAASNAAKARPDHSFVIEPNWAGLVGVPKALLPTVFRAIGAKRIKHADQDAGETELWRLTRAPQSDKPRPRRAKASTASPPPSKHARSGRSKTQPDQRTLIPASSPFATLNALLAPEPVAITSGRKPKRRRGRRPEAAPLSALIDEPTT